MQITCGGYRATAKDTASAPGLTRMEATYLGWLAMGLTRKEIARKTQRSPDTVRHGLDRAYHKLRTYRAAGAVAEAMKRGWIAPLLVCLFMGALNPQATDVLRVRQPVRTRQPVTATSRVARRDLGSIYA